MTHQNKIALFTVSPTSLTALLISAVTRCPYSHAAICVDGVWWHASESTGQFSKMNLTKFAKRHCSVFSFEGDLQGWVKKMDGIRYDWKGILGWAKRCVGFRYTADDKKFYCFEAALTGLLFARYKHIRPTGQYAYSKQTDEAISSMMECYASDTGNGDAQRSIVDLFVHQIEKNNELSAKALMLVTAKPVTGCDIEKLFPVGRSGKFGAIA